jgi:hypothetical protein
MAFANRDMSSAHHRGFMNGAVTASVRDLYRLDQLFPMAPSAPPALARRLRAWDNPDLHIGLLQALAGENWCAYLHQEHTVTSRIEFAGAVLSIPKDGVWSKLTTDRASLFLVAGPAPSDRGFEDPEVIWKRRGLFLHHSIPPAGLCSIGAQKR